MITVTSSAEMVGISVGEQLVTSLIRIGIQSDHTYGCAVHVVDYYIAHATDDKEKELLESLKKVMKMAKELND
jgi:hypothetical protein